MRNKKTPLAFMVLINVFSFQLLHKKYHSTKVFLTNIQRNIMH
jgi:hypothetical protein